MVKLEALAPPAENCVQFSRTKRGGARGFCFSCSQERHFVMTYLCRPARKWYEHGSPSRRKCSPRKRPRMTSSLKAGTSGALSLQHANATSSFTFRIHLFAGLAVGHRRHVARPLQRFCNRFVPQRLVASGTWYECCDFHEFSDLENKMQCRGQALV